MVDCRIAPSVDSMLHAIAAEAKDAVGRCDSAGVTLVDGGGVTAHGCSDPVARDLDSAQSGAGEGPGVDALRFLQIFNIASLDDTEEWPRFRRLAMANGIASSLFVPLLHAGRAIGTLNLYSRVPNGFEDCEHQAMGFASHVAAALADSEQRQRSRQRAG